MRIKDHNGNNVTHSRAVANGVREAARTKLKMLVLAVGGKDFIGEDNERQIREVSEDVRGVVLPWGHQLAEECPEELAQVYLDFFREEANA